MVLTIVAGFGIGGAYRDPGSIDPDRGSGTRVDRWDSLSGRDPVCSLPVCSGLIGHEPAGD
jgi:hypothetical protein